MSRWTAERVLQAAAEWVWVPSDAEEIHTEDYHLIAYPEFFQMPTQLAWSRTQRPPDEVIDEVLVHARALGRPAVFWWVSVATRPPETEQALTARGAALVDTVSVLGRELTGGPPALDVSPGITTVVVNDENTLRDWYTVDSEVWDEPVPDEGRLARGLKETVSDLASGTGFRVVAYVNAEPVSTGGCGLVDGVARLWGAGTRPGWQRRGAYRAVLAERLRRAAEQGATLALVKGRVTTSAPILRRAGFSPYGEERCYRLKAD